MKKFFLCTLFVCAALLFEFEHLEAPTTTPHQKQAQHHFFGKKNGAGLAPQAAAVITVRPTLTPTKKNSDETHVVARVIDGDTIVLENGAHVRYIGMDAPETANPKKPPQCFGEEATKADTDLVLGKSVRLQREVSDSDRYHRLLRDVWVGDVFVNLKLVQDGYARASVFPPDTKYVKEMRQAETEARAAKKGLWSACP